MKPKQNQTEQKMNRKLRRLRNKLRKTRNCDLLKSVTKRI